jgi:hypothetical protein
MVTGQSHFHGRESTMATSVLTRLHEIRESYTELRESYTRRRTLWRELSAYTTASDLNDIEAAVARSGDAETDPETQQIRRFLAAQRNMT